MIWPSVPIESVSVPTSVRDPRRGPASSFRYIDISSVDRHTKSIATAPDIPSADAPSRARKAVLAGDILVSTVRPNLNTVALVPPALNDQIASTGFCVLRPNPKVILGKYLFYFSITPEFVDALTSKVRGAHYPAISDADVKNVPIPLPPLSEQRRIVEILDQVDALRKKRVEADAKAARILPALFYEMFGDPATNPKGWPWVPLNDLIISGPQNGVCKPSTDYGSGTPILRIDAFYDGAVTKLSSLKRVRVSDSEKQLYGLTPGDIVINRVNSVEYLGKSAKGVPKMSDEVILFEAKDGQVRLDVKLDHETVWLTQRQMAELLATTPENVLMHLKNIFKTGELAEQATAKEFLVVRAEGRRKVQRNLKHFNLDAILSVGYRVNSRRGTQFRIWATRTLREHLVRGYTLNEQRLREKGLGEIEQAVGLLARTLTQHALVTDEGRAVLEVVQQYTRAWRLLLEYDEQRLPAAPGTPLAPAASLSLASARTAIIGLRDALATRGEATGLFGQERGEGLGTILAAIEQTFGGEALYQTVQERSAHLLYFVIKDHPFSDGNKRIGTLIFLEYLRLNRLLRRADGTPHLADNAMVALALLVAESDPGQKNLMIRLILNLMEDGT